MMKNILFFLILLMSLSVKAQTYQDHIAITGGNSFQTGGMATDSDGNLFVAGRNTGSLLLQKNIDSNKAGAVRMMSYNIKGSSILNSRTLKRITNVINEYSPDVVAVQEVSNYLYDAAATLGSQTGMYSQFLVTEKTYFGVVLLSKEKPLSVTTHRIERGEASTDPADHRGVIIAEFADYYYLCTHFSLFAEDQVRMIEYLVEFARKSEKTVFLGGDLNMSPTSVNMKMFLNNGFRMLNDPAVLTFPSTGATACIDYFLAYNEALTVMYEVDKAGIAVSEVSDLTTASDHLPIYADLNFYKRTQEDKLIKTEVGNNGIFLIKYNKANNPEWIRQIVGKGDIGVFDLKTDAAGNVYVAGTCQNFEAAKNSDIEISGTGTFFLSMMNNGNIRQKRLFPTTLSDNRYASVAVKENGDYYLGFDISDGLQIDGTQISLTGSGSIVASFSATGVLQWYQTIEPANGLNSQLNKVVIDPTGKVYVVFTSNATDIKVGGRELAAGPHSAYSCYISQFDEKGTIGWVRKMKGLGSRSETMQRDLCYGNGANPVSAAVDANHFLNLMIWGSGKRVEIYDELANQQRVISDFSQSTSLNYGGTGLMRINPNGDVVHFQSFGNYEEIRDENGIYKMKSAIAADDTGNIYLGGYTTSESFAYLPDYIPVSRGKADFFLARIDRNHTMDFIRRVGGSKDDVLTGIALDKGQNEMIAGIETNSTPAYLGLNLADNISDQEQCIQIPQNYSYLFLPRYQWSNMTGIHSPQLNKPTVAVMENGIVIQGIGEPVTLSVYSDNGSLLLRRYIDEASGQIPCDFPNHSFLIVQLIGNNTNLTYKLICNFKF